MTEVIRNKLKKKKRKTTPVDCLNLLWLLTERVVAHVEQEHKKQYGHHLVEAYAHSSHSSFPYFAYVVLVYLESEKNYKYNESRHFWHNRIINFPNQPIILTEEKRRAEFM